MASATAGPVAHFRTAFAGKISLEKVLLSLYIGVKGVNAKSYAVLMTLCRPEWVMV
jgi:hypothetical protein